MYDAQGAEPRIIAMKTIDHEDTNGGQQEGHKATKPKRQPKPPDSQKLPPYILYKPSLQRMKGLMRLGQMVDAVQRDVLPDDPDKALRLLAQIRQLLNNY
jgi:hypothetical protein